jgi:hypothetical protein
LPSENEGAKLPSFRLLARRSKMEPRPPPGVPRPRGNGGTQMKGILAWLIGIPIPIIIILYLIDVF